MEVVDLTTPWIYSYMAFLIPVPDNKANISAIVKPFQWPVTFTFNITVIQINIFNYRFLFNCNVDMALNSDFNRFCNTHITNITTIF